ncbi:MAG: TlpA family protein disulfide reductase [Alphaproteobacteria bacterium]|nr:TlpA family protein disulfide reductase [Alphaproteobacteria bacterium]MBP7760051.1 TlpA family protein disulfide reductase [Alphaproteobacteria bacterium]MBP7763413.1 TlpA family protein disulfide reductase [Alphaproteobacteria bacterium]MBP7905740.1 TlpA family protein disulfide reductase [Alphaproteobacteria bacterium]
MKAKIFIVLLLVLVGLGLEIWTGSQPPEIATQTPHSPQVKSLNIPAPSFSFATLEGKTLSLDDLKGKTLLLNFWATWCAPCLAEFPDLLELASSRPDDLVLIALSVDESPENIPAFLKRFDPGIQELAKAANVVIGLDPQKKIAQDIFGTILFPETFIIGPDLTIRRKIAGVIDWKGLEIRDELENIQKMQAE